MTRFARAHGSKASNERQPEEATSWNVLKQQLLEQQALCKKKVEEAIKPAKQTFVFQTDKSKTTEWAEFEETSKPKHKKVTTKKKTFERTEEKLEDRPRLSYEEQRSSKTKLHKTKKCSDVNIEKKLAKKLKKIQLNDLHTEDLRTVGNKDKQEFEETSKPKQEKKKEKKKNKFERSEEKLEDRPRLSYEEQHSRKNKLHKIKKGSHVNIEKKLAKQLKKMKLNDLHSDIVEDLSIVGNKDVQVKLSKREKRKNKLKVSEKSIETFSPNSRETNSELKTPKSVDSSERQLSKRQLKRLRHSLKKKQDDGFVLKHPKVKGANETIPGQAETSTNGNGVKEGEPKLPKRQKDKQKSELKKQKSSTLITNTPTNEDNLITDGQTQTETKFKAQSKRQKRNLKKLGDPTKTNQHKRRKPYVQTTTMVINGQEIEVTMLDGFPVRKQDADRLKELRKQMVDNGISSAEIEETMKLERRKAEKALARERRKVCFHCRKGGHNLSECPELNEGSNQDAAGSGICFKCGSTEHTHFECRVVRGQEFRFAKCFICQEQGHISRQCPDNPRGLYPKGGGCKVCGDVTHLKKDCPDLHEKKEQNLITLDTARSDRLEALDEDLRMEDSQLVVDNRRNKIIKF